MHYHAPFHSSYLLLYFGTYFASRWKKIPQGRRPGGYKIPCDSNNISYFASRVEKGCFFARRELARRVFFSRGLARGKKKHLRASDQGKNKTPFLPERRTRFYPLVGNKIALKEGHCNYLKRKLSSSKDRRLQAIISSIMSYLSKMPSNN